MLQLGVALLAAAVIVLCLRAGWVGDVLGLALPAVVALAATLSVVVVVWWPEWSVVPLALLAASALAVIAPRVPCGMRPPVDGVRLVAVNLLFDNQDPAGGVASALGQRPDVLVVSELTEATGRLLAAEFPHCVATACAIGGVPFGQGVFSHVPLTELDAPTESVTKQMVKVRVDGRTPFVLYAVHLPRPTFTSPLPRGMTDFAGHRRLTLALDAAARSEHDPVVITGDLNLSDRTSGYRHLAAGRRDVSRARRARTTFFGSSVWRLALLRIDHMFAPSGWGASGVAEFEITGSDHRGLVADVGPSA